MPRQCDLCGSANLNVDPQTEVACCISCGCITEISTCPEKLNKTTEKVDKDLLFEPMTTSIDKKREDLTDIIQNASGLFELSSEESDAALQMADELLVHISREESLGIAAAVCYYASKHRRRAVLMSDFAEKLGIPKQSMVKTLLKIPNYKMDYTEDAFSPLHQVEYIMREPFQKILEVYSKLAEPFKIRHLVNLRISDPKVRPKLISILKVIIEYEQNIGRHSRPFVGAALLLVTHSLMVHILQQARIPKYSRKTAVLNATLFMPLKDYSQTIKCAPATLKLRLNEITALLAEYANDITWLKNQKINSKNLYRYLDDIIDFKQINHPGKQLFPPTSAKEIPAFARSELSRRKRKEQIDEALKCIDNELEEDQLSPEAGLLLILLRAGYTQSFLENISDKNIRQYVDNVLNKEETCDTSDTLIEC
ncbi:hypothetical protein J3Q64DRAFT_1851757 [Phycomyces blakesleeanus]|uniref:TFIIB-type domain-containing protein n=1 Tax=Phycomyces blakesleeanus TaxID=4837 RepID=A0ABR3APQ7_PHYBL